MILVFLVHYIFWITVFIALAAFLLTDRKVKFFNIVKILKKTKRRITKFLKLTFSRREKLKKKNTTNNEEENNVNQVNAVKKFYIVDKSALYLVIIVAATFCILAILEAIFLEKLDITGSMVRNIIRLDPSMEFYRYFAFWDVFRTFSDNVMASLKDIKLKNNDDGLALLLTLAPREYLANFFFLLSLTAVSWYLLSITSEKRARAAKDAPVVTRELWLTQSNRRWLRISGLMVLLFCLWKTHSFSYSEVCKNVFMPASSDPNTGKTVNENLCNFGPGCLFAGKKNQADGEGKQEKATEKDCFARIDEFFAYIATQEPAAFALKGDPITALPQRVNHRVLLIQFIAPVLLALSFGFLVIVQWARKKTILPENKKKAHDDLQNMGDVNQFLATLEATYRENLEFYPGRNKYRVLFRHKTLKREKKSL